MLFRGRVLRCRLTVARNVIVQVDHNESTTARHKLRRDRRSIAVMDQHLAELRSAFNHLDQESDSPDPGRSVASALTARQAMAVQSLFESRNLTQWTGQLADVLQGEQRDALLELRERVREYFLAHLDTTRAEAAFLQDDGTLVRFLAARDFNVKKAFEMLSDAMTWRRKTNPESLFCTQCRNDPSCADLRIVGLDLQQRPCIYSSFRRTSIRTPEKTVEHTACILEKANALRFENGSQSVVWVNNFNGFGFRDLNPRFGLEAVTLFSQQYPERLALMVIVDPPAIFWGLFKVVKPFLAERTAAKVAFLDTRSGDAVAMELLKQHFDDELASFILQQCRNDY